MVSRQVHRTWQARCRRVFERGVKLFAVPTESVELTRSQAIALSKQIPLLYLILVTNVVALAYTHFHLAPPFLSIWVPALLCSLCVARLVWWRRTRHADADHATLAKRLRVTVRLVVLLGIAFTTWSLSLYRYGDADSQIHVAFFMGITVIGCIFCLMHLRAAALSLAAVVIPPFVVFFLLTGKPVLVSIATNLFLVSFAMIFVLLVHYRDFATLVESRAALNQRQIETQRLSDENFRLANLDTLTELPNRRAFFACVESVMDSTAQDSGRIAIGLIDLDGFKQINDVYGHSIGDRVLAEVGRRLMERKDPSAFFARLGGDEFGMLLRGDLHPDEMMSQARAIARLLQVPCDVAGLTLQMSASIGFALSEAADDGLDVLFERADYALYYAKQNPQGGPVIFSQHHEIERRRTGLIEQALAHADLEREFSMVFQPIVELPGKRVLGFEALARWTHDTLGVVSPAEFIRCAERSNRIGAMSEVLLKKALTDARRWRDDASVSFNLSARDIASPEAVRRMIEIVLESGMPPHRIEMEITETALVSDFDLARESIRLLKELGVRIALDDFGTGFSSLSYVHRLPLDKIKIDRSFVHDVAENATSQKVVKSIVDLCRNLDLDCVVEGAETEDQVRVLTELGCSKMQGYLFGRPMTAVAARSFIESEMAVS